MASGIFWSLLAAWLCLAAAWGALHGWIVPRIADFRPRIEAQATRALGVPVHIGSIQARSGGWVPTIALTDVTLADAEGRTALRLPLVVAALSPRSLLHLGFEQLYLDAPDVDVRRTADGRLFVAGQWVRATGGDGSRGADWLFAQPEVVVRNGTVRWTDEQAGAAPVALTDVDLLLRNGPWRHAVRLQATPPAAQGERFTAIGRFSQSLSSLRPGQWRDWSGPLYADLPRVALAPLHALLGETAAHGLQQAAGSGRLRAWGELAEGGIRSATVDVALTDLDLHFAGAPEALALTRLGARVTGRRDDAGYALATENLAFSRADGFVWPGGNLSLRHREPASGAPARNELQADRLDLAALHRVARGLPLPDTLQRNLADRAPRGRIETLAARWDAPAPGIAGPNAPAPPVPGYQAKGRVTGLAIASRQPDASRLAAAAAVEAALRAQDPKGHRHAHPPLGRPGVRGADVDFDLSEAGGTARLAITDGALDFPGVFEEPVVPVDTLQAEVRWQVGADGRLAVQVPRATFANRDAAGTLHADWRTHDEGDAALRMPGVLDLGGSLSRADGARVFRYLPQSIGPEVRHYVRDAISAGTASAAQFEVRGDLRHMPFTDPRQGRFHIAAQLRGVTYAYAPPEIEPVGALPWPALVKLDGDLLFEGRGMEIRNARGQLESPGSMRATGARGAEAPPPRTASTPPLRAGEVQVLRADARIADLSHAVVEVQARARGPLGEMLGIVDAAPLAGLTNHVLARATATGPAELQLALALPLAELRKSSVRGSVVLQGNDLRITPQTPLLGQARGTVAFTESGFSLGGTQARMLGGEVRLEGGLKPAVAASGGTAPTGPAGHVLHLQAQGSLTAEGLRNAPEIGATARLAESASGGTSYSVVVHVADGHPEVQVNSTLQGLAVDLPAPLGKTADAVLPLEFRTRLLPRRADAALQDQLDLTLGKVVAVRFLRDLGGAAPRVVAGRLDVGLDATEPPPLPDEGVAANVHLTDLDVDAWRAVVAKIAETPPPAAGAPPSAPQRSESADYLPDTLGLRADRVVAGGRTLHRVVLGGSHEKGLWKANIDAQELGGYVEYRQAAGAAPARVYARLARLQVPATAGQDVEKLTDGASHGTPAEPAATSPLPALDIVVDDFQLKDRRLGRLEVQAVNHDSEWRLNRLQLTLPEATFAASGRWGRPTPGTARRTRLDFQLDLRDSGALLGRLGMKDVIRGGAGRMKGQVDWRGSPFSPDYGSMDGALRLDVATGQFLKADPGLAKLLGVLSLQSLPRRLALDFRDVFSEGFAFDHVRGDLRVDDGIARTDNLEMKGVAAEVRMDGEADIRRETQNLRVVVVPEINVGTASLLATIVNPVVGLGTFLAQGLLRGPLIKATTREFHITGRWADPQIETLKGGERTQAR
ncbi:TIGR02099 family protein [Xylophilus sp. Kf1]|nr:TIGR02099 family protein [Xylophilus sp. Kf1]